MWYLIGLIIVLVLGFVLGVLYGKKNKKSVGKAVDIAKQVEDDLKTLVSNVQQKS